jgi:hypothetical protein
MVRFDTYRSLFFVDFSASRALREWIRGTKSGVDPEPSIIEGSPRELLKRQLLPGPEVQDLQEFDQIIKFSPVRQKAGQA